MASITITNPGTYLCIANARAQLNSGTGGGVGLGISLNSTSQANNITISQNDYWVSMSTSAIFTCANGDIIRAIGSGDANRTVAWNGFLRIVRVA